MQFALGSQWLESIPEVSDLDEVVNGRGTLKIPVRMEANRRFGGVAKIAMNSLIDNNNNDRWTK